MLGTRIRAMGFGAIARYGVLFLLPACAYAQEKVSPEVLKLVEALGDPDPVRRDEAFDLLLQRWKTWSSEDLDYLEDFHRE